MQPEPNMPRLHPGDARLRPLGGAGVGMSPEFQSRRATENLQHLPGLQAGHGLYREAFEQWHRKFVLTALAANGYHQINTAASLGIHRNSLNRWLKDLDIWPQEKRKVRGNRHA